MLEKWKEFEQIFILLSMLVLKLSFSMGCLFIAQCTEILRVNYWKLHRLGRNIILFKYSNRSHTKNGTSMGTIIRTNSSSFFFFFYVFSMLIFKPALNVPLLDSKFSNIQIIFKSHRKMEGVSFEILLLLFLLCFFLCWY